MKVIDLVKQIALKNIPKRIKYNDFEWEYDGENYKIQASSDTYMNWDYIIFNCLNEEVEIIEEPQEHKIPEKLDTWFSMENVQNNGMSKEDFIIKYANYNFETYFNKINEILDYLEANNGIMDKKSR